MSEQQWLAKAAKIDRDLRSGLITTEVAIQRHVANDARYDEALRLAERK